MVGSRDPRMRKSTLSKASSFLEETQYQVLQGINPGGIYEAIWCRDSSYIILDWFLSGNIDGAIQQIFLIWSHQISPDREEKLVYGRGSPEMKFSPAAAKEDRKIEFEGALPTSICHAGFSEVYGKYPDIDSTALMISTTSWILNKILLKNPTSKHSSPRPIVPAEDSAVYVSALLSRLGLTDPQEVTEFVIPRMLKAVNYLVTRDIDRDGLLEQGHNEDWMDTMLRAGKIVYSQACWLLALNNFADLLVKLEKESEANNMLDLAGKTIRGVEDILWSEESGSYTNVQDTDYVGDQSNTITQDISHYLVATTEEHLVANTPKNSYSESIRELAQIDLHARSARTLDTIKNRLWKNNWPLVNERDQKITGPRILRPQEYHNQTFWPWETATEILARSRFNRIQECDILFSRIVSKNHPTARHRGIPEIVNPRAYYEWINPLTDEGGGVFPFRTGISAVRIVIMEILERIRTSMLYRSTNPYTRPNQGQNVAKNI
jgi:glycogen debranching enzyme